LTGEHAQLHILVLRLENYPTTMYSETGVFLFVLNGPVKA